MEASAEVLTAMVPNRTVWLDGPAPSPTQIGARGYRIVPFEQKEAIALESHLCLLHLGGRAWIRRTIGDVEERVEVGPGDICLHPSSIASRYSLSTPIEVLQIAIDAGYLRELAHALTGEPRILHMRHGLRVPDKTLAQLGMDLLHELASPHALGAQRAVSLSSERIAIHLLRAHFDIERAGSRERSFTPLEMSTIEHLIETHLGDDIRIEEMARLLHLGAHHFTRIFKRSFARSPHELVREFRLRRAKVMLLSSEATIAEIALATGFADQSHFTRCFRQRFGEPPATMQRRLHR